MAHTLRLTGLEGLGRLQRLGLAGTDADDKAAALAIPKADALDSLFMRVMRGQVPDGYTGPTRDRIVELGQSDSDFRRQIEARFREGTRALTNAALGPGAAEAQQRETELRTAATEAVRRSLETERADINRRQGEQARAAQETDRAQREDDARRLHEALAYARTLNVDTSIVYGPSGVPDANKIPLLMQRVAEAEAARRAAASTPAMNPAPVAPPPIPAVMPGAMPAFTPWVVARGQSSPAPFAPIAPIAPDADEWQDEDWGPMYETTDTGELLATSAVDPYDDAYALAGLGIFGWIKRTINRNRNTIGRIVSAVPVVGGIIGSAISKPPTQGGYGWGNPLPPGNSPPLTPFPAPPPAAPAPAPTQQSQPPPDVFGEMMRAFGPPRSYRPTTQRPRRLTPSGYDGSGGPLFDRSSPWAGRYAIQPVQDNGFARPSSGGNDAIRPSVNPNTLLAVGAGLAATIVLLQAVRK